MISDNGGDEWLYQLHGVAGVTSVAPSQDHQHNVNTHNHQNTDGFDDYHHEQQGQGQQKSPAATNLMNNNKNKNTGHQTTSEQQQHHHHHHHQTTTNGIPIGLGLSEVVALLARAQVRKAKTILDKIRKDEPTSGSLFAFKSTEEALLQITRVASYLGLVQLQLKNNSNNNQNTTRKNSTVVMFEEDENDAAAGGSSQNRQNHFLPSAEATRDPDNDFADDGEAANKSNKKYQTTSINNQSQFQSTVVAVNTNATKHASLVSSDHHPHPQQQQQQKQQQENHLQYLQSVVEEGEIDDDHDDHKEENKKKESKKA